MLQSTTVVENEWEEREVWAKQPFGTLLNLELLDEESHTFCSGASLDLGMVGL